MISWQYRLARNIIHLRIYIVFIFFAISFFFIGILRDIKVETHLEDFLPQKHPFIQVQHRLTDIFGGLNQVSIAFETREETILTTAFLEKIILATEDLALMKDVNLGRIHSIASRHVKHVIANEEGFFVERLLRTPPRTTSEFALLEKKIKMNPNIYGTMVSQDMRSTLIQVDFESSADTSVIFQELQKLKSRYEDSSTRIHIAGRPVLEGWLNYYLPSMLKILLLSLGVISIVLFLTFRSKRGVILPLIDSSMATLWGMGTMKLMGLRLDPSTILVPFIILSLGISHSVHTLKRYYEEMRDPRMKGKHATVNTMAHLFLPGIACVLTDGFGFLSLTLVPLPTIRSMALASGCGIIANFFTSFMFTPCILSWMHRPKILQVKREETHKWVDRWLIRLSVFSLNKRAGTIVVVILIILCLVSFAGIRRITIGDNAEGTSYLYGHDPYNWSEKFINANFGGTNTYYVLAKAKDTLLKTDPLLAMNQFQQYLVQAEPQIGSSQSIVQAIKALNMFMLDGKARHFRIPDDDDTVAQYWFLYTLSGFPNDYDHLISRDETQANIKFNLKDHSARTVRFTIDATRRFLESHPDLPVDIDYGGGDIGVLAAINDIIRSTIIPNAIFISLLIFIYVVFIYRSFTAGWILFLPLLISNLTVFALFGFLGTSITSETLPLVALSEGLGINYGIYILARLHDEMRNKKRTYRDILYHTLITSGKAVFFSGFIVSAGIFVWVFSPILFQAKLGLNLCLALIFNMLTALVMIPVFVWWIRPPFLFGRVGRRYTRQQQYRKTKA